jgi:acetyltransferase-like isoleucine patch superfamily enzyme
MLLNLRDFVKDTFRFIDQILARLIYLKRGTKTYVSLTARLDIGQRIGSRIKKTVYPFLLGEGSRIEARAVVNSWVGEVIMGKNCRLGINTVVIGPVEIGDNTGISLNAFVCGENRIHSGTSLGLRVDTFDVDKVVIGQGCWIGAGAVITPGVTIGDCVIIAAGSVVTHDIPSNTIFGGVPAKYIADNNPEGVK